MIEIKHGTIEEQIIRVLQKTYPVTVKDLQQKLHLSKNKILRFLKKLQTRNIIKLDILPDKIYIRLLRNDFSFIRRKNQRKFIKHHYHKTSKEKNIDPDENMYT